MALFTREGLTYNPAASAPRPQPRVRGANDTPTGTSMSKDHTTADVAFIQALAELLESELRRIEAATK